MTTTLPSLWITSSTALLQTGQYLLATGLRPLGDLWIHLAAVGVERRRV